MLDSRPVRWIAEAEARKVCQHALLQRGRSEPPVTIMTAEPKQSWVKQARVTLVAVSALPFLTLLSRNRWRNGV